MFRMLRILPAFCILLNQVAFAKQSEIIETNNFSVISNRLANPKAKAIVFLDIDDTLITPKANMFRHSSKDKGFIDQVKNDSWKLRNFKEILSNWRLERSVMLVDAGWPALIKQLKKENHQVYGLTQMHTGSFGNIPSLEQWRYSELKKLNLTFTKEFEGKKEIIPLLPEKADFFAASFYRGIFLTGSYTKGDIIREVVKYYQPSEVIFVDDRKLQVEDVKQVCEELNIPYLGIRYRGVEKIEGIPNPEVVKLQKETLLKGARWLEDTEAEKVIEANKGKVEDGGRG